MKPQFITGLGLALAAAVSVLLGNALGLDLVHVTLLGIALGAVLVIVPDGPLPWRLAGLASGVVIAWLAFGLRAAWLPDTDTGRAVAFAGAFLVAGVVCAVTLGRLPLWTSLLGMAAVTGAYEYDFTANTPLFASESVVAVTSVLLTTMLGVVVAGLTTPVTPERHEPNLPQHREMEDV
ncbi:hypothetical protein [Aeromicrobium sp. CTD01-1L150]|uniref:hypothetical protein n=1 Tax=Aeromicrobium sp. CTD01-1L150 TaxID=3341830 RepID=UPI0035BEC925